MKGRRCGLNSLGSNVVLFHIFYENIKYSNTYNYYAVINIFAVKYKT